MQWLELESGNLIELTGANIYLVDMRVGSGWRKAVAIYNGGCKVHFYIDPSGTTKDNSLARFVLGQLRVSIRQGNKYIAYEDIVSLARVSQSNKDSVVKQQ